MRIKEIQVNGLFGMFNHKIPLNLDEHITIIYGINGVGKTMLFKILETFINLTIMNVSNYPFKELILILENEDVLKIVLDPKNVLSIYKNDKELSSYNYKSKKLSRSINYSLNQKIYDSKKSYFIKTQRLLDIYHENIKGDLYLKKIDTVNKYSKELSELIELKHKKYSKVSEELELSLTNRLVNNQIKIFEDNEELKKEAKLLEDRRNELKSVGLLENIPYQKIEIPDNINDVARAILSVNIQDMKVKLDIFNDLYTKLKLFTEIINERRFSYKKLIIDHNKGFVFVNSNEEELTPLQLSSGEQHELVMLYELLFKVEDNTLVLIDEPEISLHISWQKEFLNDLREIIKIKNFDVIIATHSPAIIDDNWDLTVELEKTPQAK
jgi:predicted ATP-binding protein involved in virulence